MSSTGPATTTTKQEKAQDILRKIPKRLNSFGKNMNELAILFRELEHTRTDDPNQTQANPFDRKTNTHTRTTITIHPPFTLPHSLISFFA